METIDLGTWEEFEQKIKSLPPLKAGSYLFRGQGDSSWLLETTLERNVQKDILFWEYYRLISIGCAQIETFTNQNWGDLLGVMEVKKIAEEYDRFSLMLDGIGNPFPAYNYMAYLRHHGFPSPLLDWSSSPYVAAYFAFRNTKADRIAIYQYAERPNNFKSASSDESQIHWLGPYVRTHRRHFLQQSSYTICLKFKFGDAWYFSSHENVFSTNPTKQDVLLKYTLPAVERVKVLRALDEYNLNALSLFESEEGLMETMAFRHIDFKRELVAPDASGPEGEAPTD